MSESADRPRKVRADSARNRDQLLEAAKAAFAQSGPEAPLEEIARQAGVGIGTLYRHFPNRAALLAGVYRREVAQLSGAAERLLAERPALEALEAWLHLLLGYLATKREVAPALQAAAEEGKAAYEAGGSPVKDSLARLLQAAVAEGAVRPEIGPEDLYRAIIGLSYGYDEPDWEPSARRLVGVLMTGLKG